jgi:hypothetical protein
MMGKFAHVSICTSYFYREENNYIKTNFLTSLNTQAGSVMKCNILYCKYCTYHDICACQVNRNSHNSIPIRKKKRLFFIRTFLLIHIWTVVKQENT